MTGTEVFQKIHEKDSTLNENTVRQRLSVLSKEPDSGVAKLDGQNGYYKRIEVNTGNAGAEPGKNERPLGSKGRQDQPEEKFRYLIYAWLRVRADEEPIFIEHTKSKKGKDGLVNKWKFPDLISVRWMLPKRSEPESIAFDWSFQSAMQNLGEAVYSLKSIELKPSVNAANARGYFFQALSNSKWAHEAHLFIAEPLDGIVADELRRLGASYGLTVSHFGLTGDDIRKLPEAKMENLDEFKKIAAEVEQAVVVQGLRRDALDWEHIYDIAGYLTDFKDAFDYVSHCCSIQKSPSFENWKSNIKNT